MTDIDISFVYNISITKRIYNQGKNFKKKIFYEIFRIYVTQASFNKTLFYFAKK